MKHSSLIAACVLAVSLFLLVVTTQASIVSYTGAIAQKTAGDLPTTGPGGLPRLFQGDLESSTFISVFDEQQNVILPSNLSVGFVPPVNPPETLPGSPVGSIASGRSVNSHLIHFDPVGNSFNDSTKVNLMGSVTFNAPILGVIGGVNQLDNTDSNTSGHPLASIPLGLTNVHYGWDGVRGMETGTYADTIQILSSDLNTVHVNFTVADVGIDQIRVITAVPIPSAVLLFGSGLIGLAFLRRKFRN
jgi:hypothetical protein